ncbi:unnamed protein product [Microthlaspi erraticum]|uniref:Uncharacterized protein n=1 Tax=Microthlaspi erraticum TaxID=1685480 RepID=A0A6D2JR90_9BRAS|nr:unnamed protein product [Microthlaspi erraticum]CAA7046472.1 unnamed protein product [Microthlaspi erraticum]
MRGFELKLHVAIVDLDFDLRLDVKLHAGKVSAEGQLKITTTDALEKDLAHDSKETADGEGTKTDDSDFKANSFLDEGNTLRMLFAEEDSVMAPPESDIAPSPQITTNPEKIPRNCRLALPKTLSQTLLPVENEADETGGDCFGYWFH